MKRNLILYFFLALIGPWSPIVKVFSETKQQYDKLIYYGENENCPVVYERPADVETLVFPYHASCTPMFMSKELSILRPECFYAIYMDKKLKNHLYSERCYIEMIKVEEVGI